MLRTRLYRLKEQRKPIDKRIPPKDGTLFQLSPKYFGFEGVGVLIFDREKSLLFTDPNFGSSLDDLEKGDGGGYDKDIDGDSGTDAEVEKRKKADREEFKKNDPDN